jgi:putative acetyltransferase
MTTLRSDTAADITVRQATADDAERVLDVKRAAIRGVAWDTYDDDQLDAWAPDEDDRDAFERVLDRADVFVLVATIEEEIAGYGVLNADAGRIDALFVHPDHVREGIGSTLLGQLELVAEMRAIRELVVIASVNAVPFYEARNYWRLEPTTKRIDGEELEFVRMRKRV